MESLKPEVGRRGTHQESGLEFSCRPLCWTQQGPIVEFVVSGGVSIRHPDHVQAQVLYEFVTESLAGQAPAGLLFDMRNFRYRHGDSIGALFMRAKPDRSGVVPVGVVAKGRTKRGLTSLLRLGGGPLLVHLVTDRRVEALGFLQREAGRSSD